MKKIVLIILLHAAAFAHANDQQGPFLTAQNQLAVIDSGRFLRAITEAGFTGDQMAQIARQISKEEHEEIVAEAVRNKIYEGLAKKVKPEGIVKAAARVINRYEFAMRLASQLRQQNRHAMAKSYVDCLAAGLTEEDAIRIAEKIQNRKTSHATDESLASLTSETLLTARDMVRQGISSQTTTAALENALAHGYDSKAMTLLRQQLRQEKRANIEEVAQHYLAAIKNGVKAAEVKGQVSATGKHGAAQGSEAGQGGSAGSGSGGSGDGNGEGNGGDSGGGDNGSGNGGDSGDGNGGGNDGDSGGGDSGGGDSGSGNGGDSGGGNDSGNGGDSGGGNDGGNGGGKN